MGADGRLAVDGHHHSSHSSVVRRSSPDHRPLRHRGCIVAEPGDRNVRSPCCRESRERRDGAGDQYSSHEPGQFPHVHPPQIAVATPDRVSRCLLRRVEAPALSARSRGSCSERGRPDRASGEGPKGARTGVASSTSFQAVSSVARKETPHGHRSGVNTRSRGRAVTRDTAL